jgi:hypothetical protein
MIELATFPVPAAARFRLSRASVGPESFSHARSTHLVCYIACVPTTRPRVNLTLSEMEQRFLETLLTAGTPQHDALRQHLGGRHLQGQDGGAAGLGLADVVHVVLKLGLERLEAEAAERSYAAEASTRTEADRARTAALRRRLAIGTARTYG